MLATNVFLKDSNLISIIDYSVGVGQIVYSQAISTRDNQGFQSLLIKISGKLTIELQVSADSTNWYTPYCSDGTTLTANGPIIANLTADRWIVHKAIPAYYTRYKFTGVLLSTISATYVYINEGRN